MGSTFRSKMRLVSVFGWGSYCAKDCVAERELKWL